MVFLPVIQRSNERLLGWLGVAPELLDRRAIEIAIMPDEDLPSPGELIEATTAIETIVLSVKHVEIWRGSREITSRTILIGEQAGLVEKLAQAKDFICLDL